ncbi:MAG: glycosyltransferase family 2 protein [Pyrinomonadaceae bacterium]|nr:glycosyltransferase family 2 protein [Pyrinomonadaceae bacterium]
MTTPTLSVVIPAYNEAPRLGKSLQTIFAYLNEQSSDSEVIVVDDGSTDETTQVAEHEFAAAGARIRTQLIKIQPNRGKGYVVRTGLLAARAPVALFSDADLSTPITETPKLVAPIRAGQYDLVIGSRALDRSLIGVHQSWRREQGGRLVNLLVRLATGMKIWDTQCGFKAFRTDVCRPVFEAATIDRFGFDIEFLFIAHLAGLRLLERPVRWDHSEGSKLNPARDGLRMLQEINLIRAQARRGVYDEAIRAARAAAESEGARPLFTTGDSPATESDVSPELASAARRI